MCLCARVCLYVCVCVYILLVLFLWRTPTITSTHTPSFLMSLRTRNQISMLVNFTLL